MDIERPLREKLKKFFDKHGSVYEEVSLRHASSNRPLRADVIAAIKIDKRTLIFAFEVKVPNEKWEFKNWSSALKQAGDYVGSIIDDNRLNDISGRAVIASFLFPLTPIESGSNDPPIAMCRTYDKEMVRGAYLFAQHYKIGRAKIVKKSSCDVLEIYLGTDCIWDSLRGARPKLSTRLDSIRLGSQTLKNHCF